MAPRRLVFLLAALSPVLSLGLASGQDEGVAQGVVINGTTATAAPGLPVRVQIFERMTLLEERQAVTEADGRFRLGGLPVGTDHRYVVSVAYKGVSYGLERALNPNDPPGPASVTVYETTEDSEGVSLLSVSSAVTSVDGATGLIQVLEVITVANDGTRAYLGDLQRNPDHGTVLRLPLLGPALDIELGDGFTEEPTATRDAIITRHPVLPGRSVLVYAYKLPYQEAVQTLRRRYGYPVARSSFLIAAGGVKPSSPQLDLSETVEINGQLNLSLSGQDFPAGEEIVISLAGLPPLLAPSGTGRASLDTSLRWAGIASMIAALAAVVVYALAARRQRWVSSASGPGLPLPELVAQRKGLIARIADLEEEFASGEVGKGYYEETRIRLRHQVTAVLLQERETKPEGT